MSARKWMGWIVVLPFLFIPPVEATTAISVAEESIYRVDLATGDSVQRQAISTPSVGFYCRDLARWDLETYDCANLGDLYRLDLGGPTLTLVRSPPP